MSASSLLREATPQRWTICSICNGEGRIKRKGRRRTNHLTDPCPTCHTAGIILSPAAALKDADSASDTRSSDLRVAIVGGGIGGLALATALHHRGFHNTTVYERDMHHDQRRQGYGLTMQQAARQLTALGIQELSNGITSTKHVVHNASGSVLGQWGMRHWKLDEEQQHVDPPKKKTKRNKRQNVHIARQALRYELLKNVQAMGSDATSIIQWNHQLVEYSIEESGGLLCRFHVQEGQNTRQVEIQADILVGADGIRSQVRQQLLPNDPLRYLDCIVILGICSLSLLDENSSSSQLLDGETVFQTADGTTRIYMMPFSTTEYMWQLSFPMAEVDAQSLANKGPAALRQAALERCGEWHTPVPEILQATCVELVSGYPVYDRALLTHVPTDRVTLVGDAAHPMSPFKGQGANQALLDALSLARSLYTSELSIEERIQRYEEEMMQRSAVKVNASAEAARFLHTSVAIQEGDITRGAAAGVCK